MLSTTMVSSIVIALLMISFIRVLTMLYICPDIIHPYLSDQCMLGWLGMSKNLYNSCLLSNSNIGQPSYKSWKWVTNCMHFLFDSTILYWLTCWRTVVWQHRVDRFFRASYIWCARRTCSTSEPSPGTWVIYTRSDVFHLYNETFTFKNLFSPKKFCEPHV